jgi:Cyclic nucleotide-binding domain
MGATRPDGEGSCSFHDGHSRRDGLKRAGSSGGDVPRVRWSRPAGFVMQPVVHCGAARLFMSTKRQGHVRRLRSVVYPLVANLMKEKTKMPRRSRSSFPLAELELFADIKRTELHRASALLTPVRLGAGRVLLKQGSVATEFLIVADGLVNVTRDDGHESKVLAMVTPGDVLGEMSLLHRVPRSATATTLVPTTVYAATPREFFALLEAVPSAAERIVEAATVRLRANMAA